MQVAFLSPFMKRGPDAHAGWHAQSCSSGAGPEVLPLAPPAPSPFPGEALPVSPLGTTPSPRSSRAGIIKINLIKFRLKVTRREINKRT